MTVACRHTKPKNINGSMGNNESEEMYREWGMGHLWWFAGNNTYDIWHWVFTGTKRKQAQHSQLLFMVDKIKIIFLFQGKFFVTTIMTACNTLHQVIIHTQRTDCNKLE
jgi:hypothetical protein